ncbi:radical SAM protein [Methanobrevibacter sp. OttesenSCG-928-K11]|nr:radical SAM protein [Methanobrevibacter sp. OttesenSCG-928-K11]
MRFGLAYPNIYKVAMASLGFQLLYNLINEREDTWCERFTYPNNRSIESNSPLRDFDIIGFSLQYEQDYFNLLEILKSSQIPLERNERNENHPLIIAGGPCASSNPLPISKFVDLFIVGDGELTINNFLNTYKKLDNPKKNLKEFLNIEGIFVSEYNNKTKLSTINDMNTTYHNINPLIIETDDENYKPAFNNSIMLNVSRGCTRGCRFCMSGYMYRPIRETNLEKLFEIAEISRKNSGFNKITLIGAAIGDYSKINELIKGLKNRNFEVSTPSLRLESLNEKTIKNLKESGLKTLTIAPESIFKLRKVINKNISDEKIFDVIKQALNENLNIKLYFLIGLPGETDKDIENLKDYIKKINNLNTKKSRKISFSVNPLIPKPHTPLQWEKYDIKSIKSKIKYLKKELKNVDIKFDSAKMGLIQYICSCGDSDAGNLIEKSLNEKVSIKEWENLIPNYNLNSKLPWDVIDVGLNNDFLKKEYEKIIKKEITPWCVENTCYNCGVCN